MNVKQIKYSFILLLGALIWGAAFVAQAKGAAVGAFTLNCFRNLLGAVVLIPVALTFDKLGHVTKKPKTKAEKRVLWIGGICCGTALFVAANLQQVGIGLGCNVGKAGFLTSCYILLVPILGIFLKRHCSWNIWAGVGIALVGLYFLCMKEGFTFQLVDLLLIACALAFSVQILLVDHFAPQTDPIRLSQVEFLVCGILSGIVMCFTDLRGGIVPWAQALMTPDAWVSILYLAVLSTGVAYTLQVVSQSKMNPTVASMIMSLESVFSALFGWILLKQALSIREGIGCALIFSAVVLSQLPLGKKSKI